MPKNIHSAASWIAKPKPGEEICITGMSGSFPDSDGTAEFYENLLNKKDLLSDDDRRWSVRHPEIPPRGGKLKDIAKFDAEFFNIPPAKANLLDPLCRVLLERAYEAVIDSGVNPMTLRGSRTGVFIGTSFAESECDLIYNQLELNWPDVDITCTSRQLIASRISHCFGLIGPACAMDSACSSSLIALENAYTAIRNGQCDNAIVGGSTICLSPNLTLLFSRLGVLHPEGKCSPFDQDAAGYARSETIGVIFLQKAKNAKRIYAQVVHSLTNCDGFKERGITFPSRRMQKELLEKFYLECEVDPNQIPFMEAHGTGTKVGDPEELAAIDQVFCKNRKEPLLIGSVKSNIGHSEPGAGIGSIVKVLLCLDSGYILPNINFKTPKESITSLVEKRIVVVTEPTEWDSSYAGVNCFGFGGANAHTLLKGNQKTKINKGLPTDGLARLVCISGRTEEAVNTFMNKVAATEVDCEFVRLLNDIHSQNIKGHKYRGYIVVQVGPQTISRDVKYFIGSRMKRPVCYLFDGIGSQWPTMGQHLIKLPLFAASIQRCSKILAPKGIDIKTIITDDKELLFENILNTLVGIVAMQVAFIDVLMEIGIKPDIIIGVGIGEISCAYADNCLTLEQSLLAAYYIGKALLETNLVKGAMLEVQLGNQQIKKFCPTETEVAYHGCTTNCTISGPIDAVKKFAGYLKSSNIDNIFLNSSNYALHSKYVANASPVIFEYLKNVIPSEGDASLRSTRWKSTSVPESQWNSPLGKSCSGQYLINNLVNPILLEETVVKYIPKNAIVIEIGPDCSLHTTLKKTLDKTIVIEPLIKRGHEDNSQMLFTTIGKLYEHGCQPLVHKLYPDVSFPVSRGTPMIAPLIKWDHSTDWFFCKFGTISQVNKLDVGERLVEVNIALTEYDYISGHVIDGRNLYPATGYLVNVWETLAMMHGKSTGYLPVVFEDVRFIRATNISKDGVCSLMITIQRGSGKFEITENNSTVVTGYVRISNDPSKDFVHMKLDTESSNNDYSNLKMKTSDVYKELRLRGYNYSGKFKSIVECDLRGNCGLIVWDGNWVTFMDNMLQMKILQDDTRSLRVPTSIMKLTIDPEAYFNSIQNLQELGNETWYAEYEKHVPVRIYGKHDLIRATGIEIRGLKSSAIARKRPLSEPVLEKYQFVPYINKDSLIETDAIRVLIQIMMENVPGLKVKVIEIDNEQTNPLAENISVALEDLPLIQADITVLSKRDFEFPVSIKVENKSLNTESNCSLVIGTKLIKNQEVLKSANTVLKTNGFIISRESPETISTSTEDYVLISEVLFNNEKLVLLQRKQPAIRQFTVINISKDVTSKPFGWLSRLQKALITNSSNVLLVAQNDPLNGIQGLINCVRKEPSSEQVRCVFIIDKDAPKFNLDDHFYSKQLELNLAMNVYKNGSWGSFRHLSLDSAQKTLCKHAYVDVTVRGDLSSLQWIEGNLDCSKKDTLVEIYYASLNFKDIMLATGKISIESTASGDDIFCDGILGIEFSGRDTRGHRVMGLATFGALATRIEVDPQLLWPVPNDWTLEDAATVPCVYATVISALFSVGNMKRGQSLLIHAGSGGIGQAAINMALHYGCQVFTTVGTAEKRNFIKSRYPQIKDQHIGNSRDTSFEQMVMRETKGRGVDFVLNSLAEEKLQASLRCLAPGGSFLEIGKFDLSNNNLLGLRVFTKERSFHGIMLDELFYGSEERKKTLQKLLSDGISNGSVKPLPRTIFGENEIEKAFRFMAAGKHIGKVLVNIRAEERKLNIVPKERYMEAKQKYYCDSTKSYVIAGGLGGFGLELADWLVFRGARKLVLTSRKGVVKGYQAKRIRFWEKHGIHVKVLTDDITTREGICAVLTIASQMGPVDAIFNLAVVLVDAILENQTVEKFVQSFGPKAVATEYFDQISRKLCPSLRQFVIFSSVSCGRGNAGQTNYGMANSIMERICEKRRAEGLPALAVQWGAIGEVGLVADMQENNCDLEIGGTLQQRLSSCLQALDVFLKQTAPIVASMVVAEKKIASGNAKNVTEAVANILGIKDLKSISTNSSLAELGVDSMMTIEIKQTLEREFELFMTSDEIRILTFVNLMEIDANRDESISEDDLKNKTNSNELVGINFILRTISDEESSAKELVRLNSLVKETEFAPVMFMIPGIEGMAQVLAPLATKLHAHAICLQPGIKNLGNTVGAITNSFLTQIKPYLVSGHPVGIVGYSFGSAVAIELAHKFQESGVSFHLILVDGGPIFLKKASELMLSIDSEDQMQNGILCAIMNIIAPQKTTMLKEELSKVQDWNSRLNIFTSISPDNMHSKSFQRDICNAIYNRIKALQNWHPEMKRKLNCPISLIRPEIQLVPNLPRDYNLSESTSGPVNTSFIAADHSSILEKQECADAINTIVTCMSNKTKSTNKRLYNGNVNFEKDIVNGFENRNNVNTR